MHKKTKDDEKSREDKKLKKIPREKREMRVVRCRGEEMRF
jgi:hypothetical protein